MAEFSPELATQRLILRPVTQSDIARIATLANDARIAEATRSLPHPLTPELVTDWFHGLSARRERAFAIVLKADDGLIGAVAVTLTVDGAQGEIGYWLERAQWGQGYMTEAVRRIVRYGFGDLKLTAIQAAVLVGNERSVRVLAKAGFEEMGRAVRSAPARGGDRDVLLFSATRSSFALAALNQAVGRA